MKNFMHTITKRSYILTLVLLCVLVLAACGDKECQHQWQDATCDAPKTCTLCGVTTGVKLEHVFGDVVDCETPVKCQLCGADSKTSSHNWQDATCENAKTCTICGKVDGEALGHDFQEATCETPSTCSRCDASEGTALGHSFADADCENAKTCTACGKTEGEPNGHNWTEATCQTAKTCATCGKTEGELGSHDWNAANCQSVKTCKLCGATDGGLGDHDWKSATCTKPKTCATCGKTEGEANGHDWKDATCEKPKTCKDCGKTEGKKLGHTPGEATCTEPAKCTTCGESVGKKLGHDWKNATTDAPKTCKRCGATEGDKLNIDPRFQTSACEVLFGEWVSKNYTAVVEMASGRMELTCDLYCTYSYDGFLTMRVELHDREATIEAAKEVVYKEMLKIFANKEAIDKAMDVEKLVLSIIEEFEAGSVYVYYVDGNTVYFAESWDSAEFEKQTFELSADGNEATLDDGKTKNIIKRVG